MDHPWGLSGPQFLAVYMLALLVVIGIVIAVGLLTKGDSKELATQSGELTVYEVAYLFGGMARVADTVVAGLVNIGSLRVTRSGALLPTRHVGDDAYQTKVLELPNGWSGMKQIRKSFGASGTEEPFETALRARGLLVSKQQLRVAFLATWLLPLLGMVGVFRMLNGIAHHYPVGLLFLELAATALATFVAFAMFQGPKLTWSGEGRKKRYRADNQTRLSEASDQFGTMKAGPATIARSTAAAMGLVAVGGVKDYPDTELALLLKPETHSGGGGFAGGGSGGGCGGGGGGGCGGGGA